MKANALARFFALPPGGAWVLVGIAAALATGTVLRSVAHRRRPDEETRRSLGSVGTWWALFALLLAVLATGPVGLLTVTAAATFVLFHELLRLVGRDRWAPWFTAAVPLYLWAWRDPATLFFRLFPVVLAAALGLRLAGRARPRRLLPDPSRIPMPAVVALIGPAYAFGLVALPTPFWTPEQRMGAFLLLVVLTELNDMAQSWWGRAVGRRPLAPVLSPNKTWEGFAGGVATTALVAVALCPVLTSVGRTPPAADVPPVPAWSWSVGLGVAIALAGLVGDLSASSLKRSAHVKDSGRLLPGQGGLLDRLDSLAVTAPVFFLFAHLPWSP